MTKAQKFISKYHSLQMTKANNYPQIKLNQALKVGELILENRNPNGIHKC